VGERHYDVGNDLYQAMLGQRMVYTCAYWRKADDLDAAQEAKLDLVCRKIGARPGIRILDLGCGWGGFAARPVIMLNQEATRRPGRTRRPCQCWPMVPQRLGAGPASAVSEAMVVLV
jgi:hypothetical protein